MICPKCGADNPEGSLFCEECDWRLDMPFRAAKKRNVNVLSLGVLACGVLSIVLAFFVAIAGAAVGAVGLIVGGYAINAVRIVKPSNQKVLMVAAAGLLLSMIGFILGFANL
jgi:predicted nucleic acid-binding Zn ribbon protein